MGSERRSVTSGQRRTNVAVLFVLIHRAVVLLGTFFITTLLLIRHFHLYSNVIFRIYLLDILWNIFEQIALVPNKELYLISEIFNFNTKINASLF